MYTTNLSLFYIVKFAILSARLVHVTAPISDGLPRDLDFLFLLLIDYSCGIDSCGHRNTWGNRFNREYFVLGRGLVKIANLRDWTLVDKQIDSALCSFWKEVDWGPKNFPDGGKRSKRTQLSYEIWGQWFWWRTMSSRFTRRWANHEVNFLVDADEKLVTS